MCTARCLQRRSLVSTRINGSAGPSALGICCASKLPSRGKRDGAPCDRWVDESRKKRGRGKEEGWGGKKRDIRSAYRSVPQGVRARKRARSAVQGNMETALPVLVELAEAWGLNGEVGATNG